MSPAATTVDLCRVTIMAGSNWADVALPADQPLVNLLPELIRRIGDEQLGSDDVVLQRLGEAPMPADQSLAALDVNDGETLYLRSRADLMPPIEFDDLIDGVATGVRERSDRWSAQTSRRFLLAGALVPVAVVLYLLTEPGPSTPRIAAGFALALSLIVAAIVTARAFGDASAAAVTSIAALPVTAVAGALYASGSAGRPPLGAATLLGAGAGLTVAALAGWLLVGVRVTVHLPVALAAALTTVVALLDVTLSWPPVRGAVLLLALVIFVGLFLPPLSYRAARIAPPIMPLDADDLEEFSEPWPGADLIQRASQADRFLSGFTVAGALMAVGAIAVMASNPSRSVVALLGVASVLYALRSRVLSSSVQRAGLLSIAASGPVFGVVHFVHQRDTSVLVVATGAILALVLLLIAAATLAGKRLTPYWGRAADLGESALSLAVFPLALSAMGAFGAVHGLGG